ncbi:MULTISPECIES: 4-(cytidine 5'-diphospho)-2-C-methyl-D-erythritol kinase [unclassified Mesorhizobium]|uniref:4-(cytidine 5'-diphospho)-2-C-methyl-D-erythritol kinase n=1 Tax=unclassified Mesorhizobium TaxID=325217 RepID=UPI0003CE32A2|nr:MULTISPECIES: 4-(cytidine 5'-diphospho)-2-C-methyl-D-erythritol kinase [unclassified Mesorhizobium]ESX52130.1 4-diphosphocytidyl-2C-methyl-D-erythritol kinase [Mesorhizobium sp. LSHC426A00]ESX58959.1 4-diphosphocytidyl-2C-methyl-D-erythritol kinase [Mesorhizobium sp. LSHC424B00]ESX76183.1 4-diphosphocytidyl-2C-methyl-D-erythritol kinase [Mesorhizobium sp. LSHC416B00]ESX87468.1 4-diphosphocytidyl-2C-methyl-D-erythritol kinase [Mesorhizobium sp. LSHC412B00]WJI64798.1 4-(cytidine 5'-diphospho)
MDAAARTWLAPAKINLALHVSGRRADGYHLLESLVVFTRFGDRVEIEPADADRFSVSGRYATSVPIDDSNLVVKAREALRRQAGQQSTPPVAIRLEKNLPVASGVGGGSSDAAAVLQGLVRTWGLDIGEAELSRIGLTLGADVPMCLAAKPLVARGVGDELSLVPDFPALALVLVNPGVAVSTPDVFNALEKRDNEGLPPLPRGFDFHGVRNWLEITRNDLEEPAQAIQPPIGRALSLLNRAGSGFSRMSGSGATCFGLFETGNVAKRAAAEIRSREPEWFVAATRSIASEGADDQN